MKYTVTLLSIACVCGCVATPEELRSKPATAELTSGLSAKHVALCIAKHWEDPVPGWRPLPVTMRPSRNGYFVFVKGHSGATFLVDVNRVPKGSETKFFRAQSEIYSVGSSANLANMALEHTVTTCQ